ncbi:hypothetical protein [Streptomyces sp. NPDC049879]|uniref:hypothetical protein n=1 Tax=Streptomyces sp. NPDC049879 TaxID=3365598 RepID=UPI00378C534D
MLYDCPPTLRLIDLAGEHRFGDTVLVDGDAAAALEKTGLRGAVDDEKLPGRGTGLTTANGEVRFQPGVDQADTAQAGVPHFDAVARRSTSLLDDGIARLVT